MNHSSPIFNFFFHSAIQNGTIYFNDKVTLEFFQKHTSYDPIKFWDLSYRSKPLFHKEDLLIINIDGVEKELYSLSRLTCAIIIVSTNSISLPEGFCDYIIKEEVLRKELPLQTESWIDAIEAYRKKLRYFRRPSRKALFLDRDGVVIEDEGYIKNPDSVLLIPSIIPFLKEAQDKNYFICIVTNQSGVGRGYYTWEDYNRVHNHMKKLLLREGIALDALIESTHYLKGLDIQINSEASIAPQHIPSFVPQWRKPRPGMILTLADRHDLNLEQSIFVGDRATDLICAMLAGVQRGYLLSFSKYKDQWNKFEDWRKSMEDWQKSIGVELLGEDQEESMESIPFKNREYKEVKRFDQIFL